MPLLLSCIFTSAALGAALAHALELRVKIRLARDAYFTVQQIYAGWQYLGIIVVLQMATLVWAGWTFRDFGAVLVPILVALAALIGAQLIFWIVTYPANAATGNWTQVPEHWAAFRARWEYSHLAGALCQGLAMVALLLAALRSGRYG